MTRIQKLKVLVLVLVGWWFSMTFSDGDKLVTGHSRIYTSQEECNEKYGAAITLITSFLSSDLMYGAIGCEPTPEPQPVKPL